MQWRITNRNDRNQYVNAEATNHEGYSYIGFMDDFQPHGIGAIYYNDILQKCGFWEHGELSRAMTQAEYEEEMNRIFNL